MSLTLELVDVIQIIDQTNLLRNARQSNFYNLSHISQLCNEWAFMKSKLEQISELPCEFHTLTGKECKPVEPLCGPCMARETYQ